MTPRIAGAALVGALALSACAPGFLSRPAPPRPLPSVEKALLEFDRYGGEAGILELAASVFAAEGLEVDPDRSGKGTLVSRPLALPPSGDLEDRQAVVSVTVEPSDGLQRVRVTASAVGEYAAASIGDPRLLDTVQRIADRMHGRIGGR